jgi:membrane protein DedA with SNARE-associated domain
MLAAFIHWITTYGLAALFVLLLVGVFGLPVPDETLLTFAGVLVRQGHLHFIPTWVTAAVGSMCGITLSYGLGRTAGASIVTRYGQWMHITHERVERAERWMEHGGRWVLTIGYFIPGVRHVTAIVAGSTELPYRVFAAYAYTGAALWSLSFITLGWYVGEEWESALATVHRHITVIVIVLIVLAAAYAIVHARWLRRPRA